MMTCGKETQGGMGHNPVYFGNVGSKTFIPLKKKPAELLGAFKYTIMYNYAAFLKFI